ncbi:hypothetical protein OEV98_11085 [Caldibacillus lycopersici]|uniref:Uncharacterized protein n=1 Tax=Perspicuibacillus lycopersici TaxID=1325689 RepID=A0AAE3IVG1_9BACI|nr:hypothetical protein [Perspicuibacillus lycopersici]MCU9614104.1 hypothetical protein [Perspicuibacillus lycopersici]
MEDDKYILIDLEQTLGTGEVHFWNQNRFGYTKIPGVAGKFEVKEAATIVSNDLDNNTVAVPVKQFNTILEKYGEVMN